MKKAKKTAPKGPLAPDPWMKWMLDRMPDVFHALRVATDKWQSDYEALRPVFERAGGDINASKKAFEVAKSMQAIEQKLCELWSPYRDVVGVCSKCNGTRVPARMPHGDGFGCLICHHFKVMIHGKKSKTG